MGNKSTKSTPSHVADRYVQDRHEPAPVVSDEPPAGGLCRRDAWDIALAWREQLRGCVRLETDAERCGLSLVDSFEWITFVFHGALQDGYKLVDDANDATAAARAATIAWYALSCCAGYSGQENPQFWRRVFTELYFPEYPKSDIVWLKPEPDRPQRPITAAIPFFPHNDKPFPRVRIVSKTGEENTTHLMTFLMASPQDTSSHATRLDQILAQLKPYILSSRWCSRPIPVAIDDVPAVTLLDDLRGDGFQESTLASSIARKDLPDLRLTSIFFGPYDVHLPTQVADIVDRTCASVVIPNCDASQLFRRADACVGWLLTDDNSKGDRFRISTLEIDAPNGRAASWCPQILSALPHSKSVTAVRLGNSAQERKLLTAADWAWIGYAIFHPDAAHSSSFTDLEVELIGVPPEHIKAFASMALGNNLPAGFGVIALSVNTTYEVARVRARTRALSDPHDSAELLWSFQKETTITLCTASKSVNHTALGDWVRAVIPGIGLGWIRSHSIVEITSRSPGSSCLRGLRLKIRSTDHPDDAMLTLLAVVGNGLRHLEIQDSKLMSSERVQAVLRLCPLLSSLRISHNGSCWGDKKAIVHTPRLPHLRELELSLKDAGYNDSTAMTPLTSTHLDDLAVLRVVTPAHDKFSRNRFAFLATLARYPRLRYAHHTNGHESQFSWSFKSYDERRAEMVSILGKLRRGVHDVYQGPMRLDCRLAFLSVIHHRGAAPEFQGSALAHFGPDVVRNIVSFSTSPTQRDVFVDQNPSPISW